MKILSKRTLYVIEIAILVILAVALFRPDTKTALLKLVSKSSIQVAAAPVVQSTVALPQSKQAQASVGLPLRLKIPGIKVDSVVEPVGLTAGGAMDTTTSLTTVGWYKLGQRPGESGSAVIAGHYGLKDGISAVFNNLHKLRAGDKLSITDELGAITSFVVRESRRYDPQADASDVFGSSDGKAHLNLITCEGVWNDAANSYPKRLVVFAVKE